MNLERSPQKKSSKRDKRKTWVVWSHGNMEPTAELVENSADGLVK